MSDMNALDTIRRARFEHDVVSIMQTRYPTQFARMEFFTRQSEAFAALRNNVLDHYFFEHRHLSPLFAVDAMANLVDSTVESIGRSVARRAA